MVEIRKDDLPGAPTRSLLALHLSGMHANSPPDTVFALDLSGLQVPEDRRFQHFVDLGMSVPIIVVVLGAVVLGYDHFLTAGASREYRSVDREVVQTLHVCAVPSSGLSNDGPILINFNEHHFPA